MAGLRGSLIVLFAFYVYQTLAQSCVQLGGTGAVTKDSSGNAYTLGCGKDLAWVGDVTSVTAPGFNSCFDICTGNAQCRMFSYNLGKCWLKTISSDPNQRPRDYPGVDMAWRQGSFERSCSQLGGAGAVYNDDAGNKYELGCGKDLVGIGDFQQILAPSYESCFNLCTQNGKCKAFSYWGGKCWLKQLPTDGTQPKSSSDANIAWIQGSFSSSSTSKTTSTSASTSAPTSASTPTGSNRSCAALGGSGASYTDKSGQEFVLGCQKDLAFVGDLSHQPASSFEACFDLCRQNPDCKAFTFNVDCWLKNPGSSNAIPTQADTGIDMAWKKGTFPSTSCKRSRNGVTFKDQNGAVYDYLCDTNIEGSDIGSVKVNGGFDDCFYQCGLKSGCNGFTYSTSASSCGLKSFKNGGSLTLKSTSNTDTAIVSQILTNGLSKAQTGSWGNLIQLPVVPIAAAYIPKTDKLLVWASAYMMASAGNGKDGNKYTWFADVDYKAGTASSRQVSNTNHNMFCPGISTDVKGRVIVNGGATDNAVSAYDPVTNTFVSLAQMNVPRGYQSSTLLSNGKMFTIGGAWADGQGGKNGEIYDPAQNKWSMLKNCDVNQILTNDVQGVYRADNHAWLFGWKNGAVFQAGPSKKMNWFTTTGDGSTVAAGVRGDALDEMNGIAVMYDAGKILTTGGSTSYENSDATNTSYVITLGEVSAAVATESVDNLIYPRTHLNSAVLPNGEVLITGGQTFSRIFTDTNAVQYPEIWSPTTKKFTRLQAKESTPRTYHSINILLPDGTVFSGGGGACGDCGVNHPDGAIFTPPYLYRGNSLATRPVINSVSSTSLKAGQTLTVNIKPGYSGSTTFSLVRVSTVTHSINTDQRRIALTVQSKSGNQYTLKLSSDYGVIIPGQYFLFVMDDGVPSVAKVVTVGL